MSEDEMRHELTGAIAKAGGLRAFARASGLHAGMLSEAANGGPVGPAILTALGLTRTVTYSRVTPPPPETPT